MIYNQPATPLCRVRKKHTMHQEKFRGLPRSSSLSRLSSNRTRLVVLILELFRTGIPRSTIALARVSVLAPNHVGVCVDGKYSTTYSWH
jgi:hypothetical protein